MGWLGRAFLWLIGAPLVEHDRQKSAAGIVFMPLPVCYWKLEVCHNTWVHVRYGPNAFHRGMQRLAFGVRWYCVV